MITDVVNGFVIFCISCRSSDMINIHFNKPKEIIIQCLKCGLEQKLIYSTTNSEKPTTKAEKIRFNKRVQPVN